MTFSTLALIAAVALCGPLLSWSDSLRLPVVVGELGAGVLVGDTGMRVVHPGEPTLTFLADIGFALVMFVAGTHVPIRDRELLGGAPAALLRLLAVVAVAIGVGIGISVGFGTGHAVLYAVLIASSSAAVILPIADSLRLSGPAMLQMLPQVAIADAACIVALPLALDPRHAGRAALGALTVILGGALVFLLLRQSERLGWRKAAHRKSSRRAFALELRMTFLALLLLAALASHMKVSIMLAGFCLGLAVSAVGEPRRLARQLLGLSEGVFSPIFFVWLGASLNLRELGPHPSMILMGVALGAGAVAAHAVGVLFKQPVPYALLTSAQLGVPVAAVTLGQQQSLVQAGEGLKAGEGAALLLGALLTIAVCAAAGRAAARSSPAQAPSDPQPPPAAPVPPAAPAQ